MRILVTGAAGRIGRTVAPALAAAGHQVTGLDLLDRPDDFEGDWHQGDCADRQTVSEVVGERRPDAVVHLGSHSGEQALPDALTAHMVTTAALLDAMVEHHVRRIVFASSNHAVGLTPRDGLADDALHVDTAPRPDTFYGVGKIAAEALLQLYADRYDIDAVACRIGSFLELPNSTRALSTWLSPGDCVRMVRAALTAPSPGFAVLYGISANTRGWWDLEPGRRLGYHPQDDAEVYAEQVPAADSDGIEGSVVGGPFAGVALYRPALDRS